MAEITQISSSNYLTYLRVRHPAVIDGATYSASKHLMTGVVCSTSYQNKPWIVASFADGSTWAYYYDDTTETMLPVRALRDGIVLFGRTTVASVASHIKDMLDQVTGLTVTTEEVEGIQVVVVQAEPGQTIDLKFSTDSSLGTLELSSPSEGNVGTAGTLASAYIVVTGVQEGGSVTQIEAGPADGTAWVNLIDPTDPVVVAAGDTEQTFAAKIVAAINAYAPTYSPDYTAAILTDASRTVYVYSPVNATGFLLRVTVSEGVVVSNGCYSLGANPGGLNYFITDLKTSDDKYLISSPVYWLAAGSDAQWRLNIVAAINATKDDTGYVAAKSGDYVCIGKQVTTSNDAAAILSYTSFGTTFTAVTITADVPGLEVQFTALTIWMNFEIKWNNGWQNYIGHTRVQGSVTGSYVGTLHGTWRKVSDQTGFNCAVEWDSDSDWSDPTFKLVRDSANYVPPENTIFELDLYDETVSGGPLRAEPVRLTVTRRRIDL